MSSVEITVIQGQFCEKLMASFEWRVPNCLSFIREPLGKYKSPDFDSFDGTWAISISTENNEIRIRLMVTESKMARIYSYKLSITKIDKAEYTSVESMSFVSFKRISVSKESIYLSETDLSRSDVAPNGVLTISCIITYYRCTGVSEEAKVTSECKEDEIADTKEMDSEKTEKKDDCDDDSYICYLGVDDLSQSFKRLLTSGEDSDVTMKVKDQEFKVHKIILQARSPVFAAMFRNGFLEKHKHVVHITDSDPDPFHRFLLFLYSGDVEEIISDETLNIYRLAHKYDVKQLKEQCVHFMIRDLSVDNFCDVMDLALLHEESELIGKTANFFSNNVREIIATIQWLTFHKAHPVEANELQIKAWNFNSLK